MKRLCLIIVSVFAFTGAASASTVQISVTPSSVTAGQQLQYQVSGEGLPGEVFQLSAIGCSSWAGELRPAAGAFFDSSDFSAPQVPGTYLLCATVHPEGAGEPFGVQASAPFTVVAANAPPSEGAGGLTNAPVSEGSAGISNAPVSPKPSVAISTIVAPKAKAKPKSCKKLKPKSRRVKCERQAHKRRKR